MTWNDIEVKWAAMARRVGSDCKQDDDAAATEIPPDLPEVPSEPTDLRGPMPPDRSAP